jgi:hypothetical protein
MQTITVSKPESRQSRMLSGDVFLTTWANFHPQIHRILHTDVEALSTHRVMHVVIFLIQPSTPR